MWRKAFSAGGLAEQARERFQQSMRSFQSSEAEEVERTARDIYEQLEKNPAVLYSLRGSKFALDVAAVAGSIAAGGIGYQDFIIAPLVASLTHQLVELLGWQVVDAQREQTRHRQQELLKQHLSGPMAEWLTQVAGDRRLVVRATATGFGPHSPGDTATRRARSGFEELGKVHDRFRRLLRMLPYSAPSPLPCSIWSADCGRGSTGRGAIRCPR